MKRQCRRCMQRRWDVYSCGHQGGGDYRRGHRWYRSSICVPCARTLLGDDTGHRGRMTQSNWSLSGLRDVAAKPEES